jgi:hypothetical protein
MSAQQQPDEGQGSFTTAEHEAYQDRREKSHAADRQDIDATGLRAKTDLPSIVDDLPRTQPK